MPSRRNLSQPEIDAEEIGGTCAECGGPLQLVRPGKWQCPRAPHAQPAAEVLPVSPELAALFRAHGFDREAMRRRPGEFTANEYAAYMGKSTSAAGNELLDMYRSGRLTRRLSSRQYYYSFVDGGK